MYLSGSPIRLYSRTLKLCWQSFDHLNMMIILQIVDAPIHMVLEPYIWLGTTLWLMSKVLNRYAVFPYGEKLLLPLVLDVFNKSPHLTNQAGHPWFSILTRTGVFKGKDNHKEFPADMVSSREMQSNSSCGDIYVRRKNVQKWVSELVCLLQVWNCVICFCFGYMVSYKFFCTFCCFCRLWIL